MKIHIVPSLAEPVGKLWQTLQAEHTKDVFYVAAPLSSTPLPIYEWVVDGADQFGDWSKATFVLMDEQVEGQKPPFAYISRNDPASYEGFAYKHFLEPLRAKTGIRLTLLKPDLPEINSFSPPIDLLILALGVKGNYANVMPGTAEATGWHVAHLIPEFRQAHTQVGSHSYENAHFREFGMSLGPQQVLSAKNIVVIVSGKKKQQLTEQLLGLEEFDPAFPLSIIYHPKIIERTQVFIQEDVGIGK